MKEKRKPTTSRAWWQEQGTPQGRPAPTLAAIRSAVKQDRQNAETETKLLDSLSAMENNPRLAAVYRAWAFRTAKTVARNLLDSDQPNPLRALIALNVVSGAELSEAFAHEIARTLKA